MKDEHFNYTFTDEELKNIVLFFRKNDSIVPSELGNFKESVESYIYNSMSIDEAEVFFNENS